MLIAVMSLTTHPSQGLLGLTSTAGSPILVFMKLMMSSGKFCDWPMTWCSSGLFGTGSARLSASRLKRIRRIRACRCSMEANCDVYALWLVLVNRTLLLQCSSSPYVVEKWVLYYMICIWKCGTNSLSWIWICGTIHSDLRWIICQGM